MKFVFVLLSLCVYFSPSMSYYGLWNQPSQPSPQIQPVQQVQPQELLPRLPLLLIAQPEPVVQQTPTVQIVQPEPPVQQPPPSQPSQPSQPSRYYCYSTRYPGVAMIFPGEIIYVANKCVVATCKHDKSISYQKCGQESALCMTVSPGDLTLPFPHCCPKTSCYDRLKMIQPQ